MSLPFSYRILLFLLLNTFGCLRPPLCDSDSDGYNDVGKDLCDFDENSGYINQIKTLINDERQSNGLSKLSINSQLATAAQKHAADMACSSILSHTGSDDSYVNARIAATGYSASYSEEIIYAGGGPKVAFDWWMDDKPHRDAILSTKSTEMGIGYAYLPSSTYGGYFTVDFAKP